MHFWPKVNCVRVADVNLCERELDFCQLTNHRPGNSQLEQVNCLPGGAL